MNNQNRLVSNYNLQKQKPVSNNLINHINKNITQDNMEQLRKAYELKKLQKQNDLANVFDKNIIHEAIINPIKIQKTNNSQLLEKQYLEAIEKIPKENEYFWAHRTNKPYKNILYNEDYTKEFKTKEDLIIHKTTKQDKDKNGVEKKYTDLLNIIKKENTELQKIYSKENEAENYKKFTYENRDKFKIKYNPKEFDDLKTDNKNFYDKQNEKINQNKTKIQNAIQDLVNSGLLDKTK